MAGGKPRTSSGIHLNYTPAPTIATVTPPMPPTPPTHAPSSAAGDSIPKPPSRFPHIEAPGPPPTAGSTAAHLHHPAEEPAVANRPVVANASRGGLLSSPWVWALGPAVLVGSVAVATALALTWGNDKTAAPRLPWRPVLS